MIAFHTDLDNTLIFSYRHDIGTRKRCVELYQGREVSFVTERTAELLKRLPEEIVLIPTTTRMEEQYRRIDLGIGTPAYALVCNGGVLLVDGQEEEGWYRESMELVAECKEELARAEGLLRRDPDRSFEVRNIRELFLFTKSEKPELSAGRLRRALDLGKMEVFTNGCKVYVLPKRLNKGRPSGGSAGGFRRSWCLPPGTAPLMCPCWRRRTGVCPGGSGKGAGVRRTGALFGAGRDLFGAYAGGGLPGGRQNPALGVGAERTGK